MKDDKLKDLLKGLQVPDQESVNNADKTFKVLDKLEDSKYRELVYTSEKIMSREIPESVIEEDAKKFQHMDYMLSKGF